MTIANDDSVEGRQAQFSDLMQRRFAADVRELEAARAAAFTPSDGLLASLLPNPDAVSSLRSELKSHRARHVVPSRKDSESLKLSAHYQYGWSAIYPDTPQGAADIAQYGPDPATGVVGGKLRSDLEGYRMLRSAVGVLAMVGPSGKLAAQVRAHETWKADGNSVLFGQFTSSGYIRAWIVTFDEARVAMKEKLTYSASGIGRSYPPYSPANVNDYEINVSMEGLRPGTPCFVWAEYEFNVDTWWLAWGWVDSEVTVKSINTDT